MSTYFKPTMSFKIAILDNAGAVTKDYDIAVNDKLNDLKYINSANKEVTVSGVLTGMTIIAVPKMPYAQGNVDLTPEILSSFELEKNYLAKNDGKFYQITTIRIVPDAEEDAPETFHSLYIPVDKITDVGAVVPADAESYTVIDTETTDAATGKVSPTVTEVKVEKAEETENA